MRNLVTSRHNKNRLRVLLVPDFLSWILGKWAQQIARAGARHDYYLFSEQMISLYADEWRRLLETVDVVHFLNQWEVKSITVPAKVALITSIHHVVNEKEWEEQLAPLTEANAIMVVAEEWKAFLLAKGLPPERIHLFYNGVCTAQFYPFQDKFIARKQIGIRSTTPLIGYSAKFTSDYGGRKGIDIFIDSLKIAATAGKRFGVVITGPGWDTSIQQIKSLGIETYYYPFLPDRLMPTYYNGLDLYVVTSRIEGGPAPLIESMACGVPVVTTSVGIAKDYIQDGINGLLVPKDDASACANSILRLLTSTELRYRLANAGLQTVKTHLTWDKTLAGIEDLYEYVYKEKKTNITESANLIGMMNPAAQRKWAISADAYIWHEGLYNRGYRREGLRGMLMSSLQVNSHFPKLLRRTFSTIRPTKILHKIRKAP